jgi:hypothetical protein
VTAASSPSKKVSVVRRIFDVKRGSPIEAFVAEAPRHPVFRLTFVLVS